MDPRAAETAATQISRARQFALHSSLLAAASLALTFLAWFQLRSAFGPLAVLTAAEGVVALCAHYWSLDLLQRLALDPDSRAIPDAVRYRRFLTRRSERRRLAGCINSIIREAAVPGSFVLRERVALVEDQLRMVASQLASPDVAVHSRSLIMCVRLLSRGVESPLFNPRVPVEDLYAALHRIRNGIGGRAAAEAF